MLVWDWFIRKLYRDGLGRTSSAVILIVCMCVEARDSNLQIRHTKIDESRGSEVYSNRYVLIYPTTHPHDPCATLHINGNLRNAVAIVYKAPHHLRNLLDENSYHTPKEPPPLSSSPEASRCIILHNSNNLQNAAALAYGPLLVSVVVTLFANGHLLCGLLW